MPLTELDPTVALVVIDLQAGTLSAPLAHPAAEVVGNTVRLVEAFHHLGLPVVFASVVGMPAGRTTYGAGARSFPPEFTALAPELDVRPDDLRGSRSTWSAFAGTDLDAQLKALGVSQVVLAGLATSFGVESTARAAYDLGYSVLIAKDATSDRSIDSHTGSLTRVFPALGQVGTASEIVDVLAAR